MGLCENISLYILKTYCYISEGVNSLFSSLLQDSGTVAVT